MNKTLILFNLLLGVFASIPLRAVPLVKEGKAVAVVVLAEKPESFDEQAVRDLVSYVQKMTKVRLEVIKAGASTQGRTPIFVGAAARPAVEKLLPDGGKIRGSFVLKSGPDGILAYGPGEGTYYAVVELLEQQGVRWFMPGEMGTVVPEMKTLDVAEQQTVQAPSFESRWIQMPPLGAGDEKDESDDEEEGEGKKSVPAKKGDKKDEKMPSGAGYDWQLRARCGGPRVTGGHGMPGAPTYRRDKKTGVWGPPENAEYHALVNGKRASLQLCLSNPKLVDLVADHLIQERKNGKGPQFAASPSDGRGFCECPGCKALDGQAIDKFSGEPSYTDRYIWFLNKVLEKVVSTFPDTQLALYMYGPCSLPPQRYKPHPNIIAVLAPIDYDRVHGLSNPLSPEKFYLKNWYKAWTQALPNVYDRGYWSNLSCPGLPFVIVSRLRDDIPLCHDLGIKGWRVQIYNNFASQFPGQYISGKLMWNHKADVDALMKDCSEKFFGPSAGPMGQYLTLMDATLRDSDYSTGSSWDMPHFYPPELRVKARGLLDEGSKLAAGQEPYSERVRVMTESFNLLEAFLDMLQARVQVDFIKAKDGLDRMDRIAHGLMDMKPIPMLDAGTGPGGKNPYHGSGYTYHMDRFFRPCTEQGYARVSGDNKLVAAAGDEWQFLIDPMNLGEEIGLWSPLVTGGNWQKIRTSSESWSNQGLRYYKGLAWYRQTVDVPESFVGKRIFLWCGGVDETAKVWVNGKMIGISSGAAFYPFELDATDAMKAGKNSIVICVANKVLNELGVGGITGPVMLYAPGKGKDAQLQNKRELKTTFP